MNYPAVNGRGIFKVILSILTLQATGYYTQCFAINCCRRDPDYDFTMSPETQLKHGGIPHAFPMNIKHCFIWMLSLAYYVSGHVTDRN